MTEFDVNDTLRTPTKVFVVRQKSFINLEHNRQLTSVQQDLE